MCFGSASYGTSRLLRLGSHGSANARRIQLPKRAPVLPPLDLPKVGAFLEIFHFSHFVESIITRPTGWPIPAVGASCEELFSLDATCFLVLSEAPLRTVLVRCFLLLWLPQTSSTHDTSSFLISPGTLLPRSGVAEMSMGSPFTILCAEDEPTALFTQKVTPGISWFPRLNRTIGS